MIKDNHQKIILQLVQSLNDKLSWVYSILKDIAIFT